MRYTRHNITALENVSPDTLPHLTLPKLLVETNKQRNKGNYNIKTAWPGSNSVIKKKNQFNFKRMWCTVLGCYIQKWRIAMYENYPSPTLPLPQQVVYLLHTPTKPVFLDLRV